MYAIRFICIAIVVKARSLCWKLVWIHLRGSQWCEDSMHVPTVYNFGLLSAIFQTNVALNGLSKHSWWFLSASGSVKSACANYFWAIVHELFSANENNNKRKRGRSRSSLFETFRYIRCSKTTCVYGWTNVWEPSGTSVLNAFPDVPFTLKVSLIFFFRSVRDSLFLLLELIRLFGTIDFGRFPLLDTKFAHGQQTGITTALIPHEEAFCFLSRKYNWTIWEGAVRIRWTHSLRTTSLGETIRSLMQAKLGLM